MNKDLNCKDFNNANTPFAFTAPSADEAADINESVELVENTPEQEAANIKFNLKSWLAGVKSTDKPIVQKSKLIGFDLLGKAKELLQKKQTSNVGLVGQTTNSTETKKDNTLLYIGIGVSSLAVIGTIVYFVTKPKK